MKRAMRRAMEHKVNYHMKCDSHMKPKNHSGFTVIEMMMVVAIVAILAAISYPTYQGYIVRANRGVGEAALLEVAARQEQFFATNSTYANALDDLGYNAAYYIDRESQGTNAAGAIYLISVAAGPNVAAPFTTYTLTATRQNYQTRDEDCGNLGLSHLGVKTTTVAGEKCW